MERLTKNNPIAKVIKNYTDKKSGKVSESGKEIKRRFAGLDWKDQKRAMAAFLNGSASDREWVYARLIALWDASFEQQVEKLWETYHEEKCGWVIIRHFSKGYLVEHLEELSQGRNYYFICRRFADDADFIIDKTLLRKTDYLMALSHSGKTISDSEATDILCKTVRDIAIHRYPYMELSRNYIPMRTEVMTASDFNNVAIALYYLDKMGNNDVVCAFRDWERRVQNAVGSSDEYDALKKQPLSDYSYKERLALIVQKYLYTALPDKYKTMVCDRDTYYSFE